MTNRRVVIVSVALLLAGSMQMADAANDVARPDIVQPAFIQNTGTALTPTDEARLAAYRNQLEVQQRAQQLNLNQGSTRPKPPLTLSPLPANPAVLSRNLFQTQSELNRVNGLIRSGQTAPAVPGAVAAPRLGFTSFNPGMPAFPH